MMSFATTWLIDALIFYVNPAGAAEALGIFFIVFSVFAAFMLASALPKRALAAVLVVAVPRFLVAGIAEITGSPGVARAGAAPGFLLAAVAMYTAFALLMEDSRGREVLPIGRLGMARQATHRTLAIQLRDIERQAGVGRTL
jgi:succinate-acetate transporter protein